MDCVQLTFRGVRSSKFRHVYGSPARKDQSYECLKITKNAHDSHFCAVNPKFVAVVTETAGGGSFLVIPIEKTGRLEVNAGKVTGHRGPVLDLKWNPFNDNVIASSSDDCTIKLWYIPDGGLSYTNLSECLAELSQHRRRVGYIEWHPTAENILFSAGFDHQILVWNVSHGKVVRTILCHPDSIYSMSLNRDGSLLATTCKDKKLRIIDSHSGNVIREGDCHQGAKASKVVYLGDTGRLMTTGFSKFSDRQWAIWTQHDLTKPLRIENIDSSSGVLFPYYDHDTKLAFIAGKGDGNIRYYEIVNEAPWCHYLSQYLSGSPQRGLGFMPKRGLEVLRCEVFRFYKLHATKQLCEPISMIVPRKSEQFQDDLFPDTSAPTPALTAEEWLTGKNKNPILISLKSGAGAKTHKPVIYKSESNCLMTADRNNEQKFIFLSQGNAVDYRQFTQQKNNINTTTTVLESYVNGSLPASPPQPQPLVVEKKFPWSHEPENTSNHVMLCDIVSSHMLPMATYVTIKDADSAGSDSEVEIDNGPKAEFDLRKAYKQHVGEIKLLRDQLQDRDKKIKDLEEQVKRLQTSR